MQKPLLKCEALPSTMAAWLMVWRYKDFFSYKTDAASACNLQHM